MIKNVVGEILQVIVRIIFIGAVILAVVKGTGWVYQNAYALIQRPAQSGESKEVTIEIPKGIGTEKIASILKKNGLIENELFFRVLAKLNGYDSKFQTGKFQLDTSMDEYRIMEILIKDGEKRQTVKFTIPEGYTILQIANKMVELGVCKTSDEFVQACNDISKYNYDFVQEIPERNLRLQGYLFPDTYEIYADAKASEVIEKMLKRFDAIYDTDFRARTTALGYTIDQVVNMASIIEKEVRVPEERKLVASVINNRMKIDMPLQMCSTVMYVLNKSYPQLTIADTKIDSPYNTYINRGLPAGPIANPGKAALEAVLYPEETDYIYFVLKDAESGEHVFSRTLDEHNAAKAKYKDHLQ